MLEFSPGTEPEGEAADEDPDPGKPNLTLPVDETEREIIRRIQSAESIRATGFGKFKLERALADVTVIEAAEVLGSSQVSSPSLAAE